MTIQSSDCDVTGIVYILSCILDVVAYVKVLLSLVEKCDDISSGYDVIYSAYDATDRVGVVSYKSACDISGDVLLTKIQLVRCLIQWV